MLWQVSTVIIAKKEIIALSSGPEAVSAHPSHDPHHPHSLFSSLLYRLGALTTSPAKRNPSKNWMIIFAAFLKVKAGQHQQSRYLQDLVQSNLGQELVQMGSKPCRDQIRAN